MAEIKGFIEPIVRNEMKKRERDGIKDEKTLLGHLLDVTDGVYTYSVSYFARQQVNTTAIKDMKVIVDETLNILLAGRDTVCLASFINLLHRNPHLDY